MLEKTFLFVLALAAAAVPAQAKWRVATTPHFVIYSEDDAKTLHAFATKLERFDEALRVLRTLPDPELSPSNRLTIFVVDDQKDIRNLLGTKSKGVGGFYIGRASGSFAFTPRSLGGDEAELMILLHEYGHHFMFQNYPGALPVWLIEGFAEFNSTATFEKNGTVGIGVPASHRAYSLVSGPKIKIEKLLTAAMSQLREEEREALYSRGWLLTHFLTFEPSRRGQLTRYVAEINKGSPSLEAAQAAFGDLNKLEGDLEKYLLRERMSYFPVPADKIQVGTIAVRDLTHAEEAMMAVRIRSKRGVDRAGAAALLPDARKAAAPFPNDPFAQTVLAEAEYDAGNYAEAEAAADRALAADPKAAEAMIYKGRARVALAETAASEDPAVWKEARKWFLAANKLEPEDPEPLMLYYQSFGAAGEPPTANAAEALKYALVLAPQDPGLRWMTGFQLLVEGKAAEARNALAPLAFDPHGGGNAARAAAIIAMLDKGGAKAALDRWNGAGAPTGDGEAEEAGGS